MTRLALALGVSRPHPGGIDSARAITGGQRFNDSDDAREDRVSRDQPLRRRRGVPGGHRPGLGERPPDDVRDDE